ncbi:type IV pilin-like G/H family protein [Pseudanabaena sp. FACHB-1998]|uniref:type IV pilin-like G/H family protein n=1 Tax=Pseudanabaena sp. FACHB-1998 TaxID=2692858 RepID=UPI00168104F3|nr:type IV pilin-like G/H family protein [Pseudanabaena sp. FACHB-1998]MBD2175601.1 type IV pilin-like G/H family protein [Pseudanabaena sp. FACHB-1998]
MNAKTSIQLVSFYLSKLSNRDNDNGFTLIELLVVIIIIGLLAAIALPSFLNQVSKARAAEAKSYVGTVNRLQQAYYMEKKTFTTDLNSLGAGVVSSSTYYDFSSIQGDINGNIASSSPSDLSRIVTNSAIPKAGERTLRAFVSVVGIIDVGGSASFSALVCDSSQLGQIVLSTAGSVNTATVSCPSNFYKSFQ